LLLPIWLPSTLLIVLHQPIFLQATYLHVYVFLQATPQACHPDQTPSTSLSACTVFVCSHPLRKEWPEGPPAQQPARLLPKTFSYHLSFLHIFRGHPLTRLHTFMLTFFHRPSPKFIIQSSTSAYIFFYVWLQPPPQEGMASQVAPPAHHHPRQQLLAVGLAVMARHSQAPLHLGTEAEGLQRDRPPQCWCLAQTGCALM
jgi:hypothetical protein